MSVGVGVIGAGAFASGTLVPAIAAERGTRLVAIASSRGFSARHLADKYKFESCTTDTDSIIEQPEVDAVFIRYGLSPDGNTLEPIAGSGVLVSRTAAPRCLADNGDLEFIGYVVDLEVIRVTNPST